jgi:hypothetical protein
VGTAVGGSARRRGLAAAVNVPVPLGGAVGPLLNLARAALKCVAGHVRQPLKVEVRRLSFDRVDRGGVIVVITPYPVRYAAELFVTNTAARAVYIQGISLAVETQLPIPAADFAARRLEPDEPTEMSVSFPLDDERTTWPAGTFTLSVLPTRPDLLQDGGIVGTVIPAARPRADDVVGGAPGDPEHRADSAHGVGRHRPDSLRNDGVFFTISWAARRISTSMVLRSRARSSSRILAYASRN